MTSTNHPARVVTITDTGDGRILVQSPFNADLPPQARALGGRWIPTRRGWSFDARDRQRVQDLHQQIFGDSGADDTTGINVVTLRVTVGDRDWDSRDHASLVIAGRPVAQASGRDSGARLGSGVVLLAGRVRSGGSVKNWRTIAGAGTVLLVRDVGAAAAQAAIDSPPNGVTIAIDQDVNQDDDTHADSTDVTAPAVVGSVVDRAALQVQRAQLVAQIAAIDTTLSTASTTQGD